MEIKVGDVYIRIADGQICRVKRIDHTMVVLELENETRLSLTSIFGLEKGYTKKESEPVLKTPASAP